MIANNNIANTDISVSIPYRSFVLNVLQTATAARMQQARLPMRTAEFINSERMKITFVGVPFLFFSDMEMRPIANMLLKSSRVK